MYLELQNIEVGKKEFLKLGHTYCKGSCQKKTELGPVYLQFFNYTKCHTNDF